MSEIDRLYQYKTMLSGRRAMSREDIMQKLEISLATFKRDIAKLRDQLRTPIVFDRDLGGYRLEQSDSTELPGLWFSQDEMLALMTIQNMIVQLEPGLLGPKLKPLQKRLDDMLTSQGLDASTLTQRVWAVHAGKRHLTLTSFETVAKATLERKQVQIEHLNRQNGELVLRDISPQQLVHYRDNWYVDAWCHLRGGLRSFSIDAIEGAHLLSKAAKDIDLISMRLQLGGGYGIFGGMPKAWAQLRFSAGRAPWVEQEIWHPDQKSQRLSDGSYELVIPYADERELIGDILRFGAEVQVIGPARLRAQVKAEIDQMTQLYGR
jgi:predicted DNA-binding transcriptional regulator YafY